MPDRIDGRKGSRPRSTEETVRPAVGLRHSVSAFRHRNFVLFWVGGLITNSGNWIQIVAVPYVLFLQTHSPTVLGLAAFLQFFPSVVVAPWGGSLADRFDRRRMIQLSQVGMGIVATGLWIVWITGAGTPALILGFVAAGALFNGVNIPNWQALVAGIVPREDMLNAVTLNSLQNNAARAIGSAVGGIVLATAGVGAAFALNAVTFLAPIITISLIRDANLPEPRGKSEHSHLRDFLEGLRYLRASRGILVSTVLLGLACGLGAPIPVLFPIYAEKIFHVTAGGYGVLVTSFGVGSVAAAFGLGGFGHATSRANVVRWSLGVVAASAIALGVAPSLAVACVPIVILGGALLISTTTVNTSVQLLVDERMRGRVLSVFFMVYTSSIPLGSVLLTTLTSLLSVRAATVFAGSAVAGVALFILVRPEITESLDHLPSEAFDP